MVTEGDPVPARTATRVAGLVLLTIVLGAGLVLAGRALLASDENPDAGIAEQEVFRRLVRIPDDATVILEPAWAATYYGTLLVDPAAAPALIPGGDLIDGGGDANDPAYSYHQYTTEGDWTCLAYADLHDAAHPSPLIPVEQLDAEARTAYESGRLLLANIGVICGVEDQFPDRP